MQGLLWRQLVIGDASWKGGGAAVLLAGKPIRRADRLAAAVLDVLNRSVAAVPTRGKSVAACSNVPWGGKALEAVQDGTVASAAAEVAVKVPLHIRLAGGSRLALHQRVHAHHPAWGAVPALGPVIVRNGLLQPTPICQVMTSSS